MTSSIDPVTGWPVDPADGSQTQDSQGPLIGNLDDNVDLDNVETDENGVATPAAGFEAMKAVIDPEIGINVVDLGLVYDITIEDNVAYCRMTLTSMGCPLTELLHTQAVLVLARLPGIEDADVEFVFSPPWSTDMISPDAKEELRALGFNV